MQNIFRDGTGKLPFAKFRMLFFPHMTLAGHDPELKDDCKSAGYSENAWKTKIAGNLLQLDRKIRDKISSKYTSVR